MTSKISWKTERRKINDLVPHEKNPRKLSKEEKSHLEKSIKKFNLVEIPVINKNNTILAGHQRLKVMQLLNRGEEEIDVRVPEQMLSEEDAREYLIRSNRNHGEWDWDILQQNFQVEGLVDWGFDMKEINLNFYIPDKEESQDVPEPSKEPRAKRGEIYTLDRHKIMCGDSTNVDDVALLMDGKNSDISFTSPPYNLGISAQLSGNTEVGKRGNVYESHDDDMNQSDWLKLMIKSTDNSLKFSEYVFYNVQSLSGNSNSLWKYINHFSKQFCDVAIWDKGHSAPAVAKNVMNSRFEFIFIFSKNNPNRAIRTADFRGTVDNVFCFPPQRKNEFSDVHGATFPIQIPNEFISKFSKLDDIVLDLFLGTGTTLIACEKTKRICFGCEIDPSYVDVCIKRYCNFTGANEDEIYRSASQSIAMQVVSEDSPE